MPRRPLRRHRPRCLRMPRRPLHCHGHRRILSQHRIQISRPPGFTRENVGHAGALAKLARNESGSSICLKNHVFSLGSPRNPLIWMTFHKILIRMSLQEIRRDVGALENRDEPATIAIYLLRIPVTSIPHYHLFTKFQFLNRL